MVRAPRMAKTLLPASFRAWTWGQTTALPMPPPTQTTVLPVGIAVALPRGAGQVVQLVADAELCPASRSSCRTSWKTRVMVPLSGFAVGDGQGDPFALIVDAQDDELAGLAALGDVFGLDLEEFRQRSELLGVDNLVPHDRLLVWSPDPDQTLHTSPVATAAQPDTKANGHSPHICKVRIPILQSKSGIAPRGAAGGPTRRKVTPHNRQRLR